jgi:hypothetical protein
MHKPIVFAVVTGMMVGCATAGTKMESKDIKKMNKGEVVMAAMLASRTLSVSIGRHPSKVYEFVSDPENLPKWAKGLGKSVKKQGTDWIVDTPQGPMMFRFVEKNNFGVLDHYVTTASGIEIYVPMRVLANDTGSEVIFTLFRLPDMTDEKYTEDMKLVEQDLQTLKDLLEK